MTSNLDAIRSLFMHIAIFYQYYNSPDCPTTARLYSFLQHWSPRHKITLLTTKTHFDKRLSDVFDWVPAGVNLIMFDVPYDNIMGVKARLLSYARFALKALAKGFFIDKPDVILGISTPLTTAWAAACVARLRNVPWVFMVKDLWPDFPIQMGAIRHPWLQDHLYTLEHHLYNSASHITPFSPDMMTHVLATPVLPEKVTMQFNGTDFGLIDACSQEQVEMLRTQHALTDKYLVLYGGSFGRANDISTLLTAAKRLSHRHDIHFVFVGYGFESDSVKNTALSLANVTLLPPQPRHHMFAWFKLADVSLVSFLDLPVLATNSPAKFFDSLGVSTPVIVTNPGWTKRFVETHECGWYVPPENPRALATCIEHILSNPAALAQAGKRGATIARQQFDRTILAAEMESILLKTAGIGRS
ncbi:MAG TPA: glycosyltransferase family 4 protein [Rhodothermales bacterium]|nr:glycosyltransferase family 4 protein [Rhodothermales bacterium]